MTCFGYILKQMFVRADTAIPISQIYTTVRIILQMEVVKQSTTFLEILQWYELMVRTNLFISPEERHQFNCIYTMVRRMEAIFARLGRTWRWNRGRRYGIEESLDGTPLSVLPPTTVIRLMENRTIYAFRIADLLRIVRAAVLNGFMFVDPLPVRNPYTNLPFNVANMYNIYNAVEASRITTPMLLVLLHTAEFNMDRMAETNEAIILDMSIREHTGDMGVSTEAYHIREMLDLYECSALQISPDEDFPDTILAETFRYIIPDFLLSQYSRNTDLSHRLYLEVGVELQLFYKKYPRFGHRFLMRSIHFKKDSYIHEYSDLNIPTGWGFRTTGATTGANELTNVTSATPTPPASGSV